MKIFSLLTLVSAELSQFNYPILTQFKSCTSNTFSCISKTANTCCTPYYGLVVLTLQWNPTLGPKDEFTIHGLWPNYCNGTYAPTKGCDSERMYTTNFNDIVTQDIKLIQELNTYWGSYKGNNPEFWKYEWGKHGTCVTTLDPKCYNDKYQNGIEVIDYFKKVLQLRKQYDFYKPLKESGIIPGRTYNLTQIEQAIVDKWSVKPMIDCKNNKLFEIRLYYRVKGKDHYILTDAVNKHNCPLTGIEYTMKV